jgi:DNA-binding transcriptional regulator YhcF (GntR family)
LQSDGVLINRRTAGTYVAGTAAPRARRQGLRILTERVDTLLAEARQMDVGLDELLDLLRQRAETMQFDSTQG